MSSAAQVLCFDFPMMNDWLDQLPQIEAAITDAERRIERQTKFLKEESRQEAFTSNTESVRSLELMLILADCLHHCRIATIAHSASGPRTRY